jgi:hypothetical protein
VAYKTEIMAVQITSVPDGGGEVVFNKELRDPVNPFTPFFVYEDTLWLHRQVWVEPVFDKEET